MMSRRILLLLLCIAPGLMNPVSARLTEPEVSSYKYNIRIDMKKAYVGGILIMKQDGSSVDASIVNEFGISIMNFHYDLNRGKLKICNCIKQLRSPLIRRILKTDLKKIMVLHHESSDKSALELEYTNSKHNITYNLNCL